MKRLVIFILLVVVLASWIYHFNVLEKKQKEYSAQAEETEQKHFDETNAMSFELFTLKEDMQVCTQNEGLIIDETVKVRNEEQELVLLKDVFQGKTLVVRISQSHCQVCIETVIPMLKASGIEDIVILADYTNKRFLKKFKENHEIEYRCFTIENSPRLPIDDLNIPYLYVMDKNMQVDCLFIPHKEIPEQTERYLKTMAERL